MAIETRTEDIFGILDDAIDAVEKSSPRPVKRKKRILPAMPVKKSHIPAELSKVKAGNVVFVPTATLRSVTSKLDLDTRRLNRLFLKSLMPSLLAYQASVNYTQAALKEGLDLEVEFDPGLLDCVQHVGYLSVVMHFIKNSPLPRSVKRRFINHFSDQLAEQAVKSMVTENAAQTRRKQMQELQAVVYSRQQNKVTQKTADENGKSKDKPVAIKKSRRQR